MQVDLNALEALENAATKAPWEPYFDAGNWINAKSADGKTHDVIHAASRANGANDRDFVAALRNAAPSLFAELREARERIAQHESELRDAFDAGHAQGNDEAVAYEWGSRPSQSNEAAWKSFLRDREIDRERAARLLQPAKETP